MLLLIKIAKSRIIDGYFRRKVFLKDERPFDIAVEEELSGVSNIPWHSRYIHIGKYASHLKKWYDYFPKEQLPLLDARNLKNRPMITLRKVTDFLGIQPYYQDFDKTAEKLEGLLESPDKNMNRKFIEYNVSHYDCEMSNETEDRLRKYYIPYDEELFKMSTIKFSWINR